MFTLEQLLEWLDLKNCWKYEQNVYRSLETDSRLVGPESVFIALPGVSSNGWDYFKQVVSKGCQVAVVPKGLGLKHDTLQLIEVDNIEEQVAKLCRRVYGPAPQYIVAVTGTNGKSSICYYIAQLAQAVGLSSAMIGTFGIGPLTHLQEAQQTTPDLLTLHKLLSSFAAQGIQLVAFEASSHALDQKRLAGVPVSTAVFSNLTRDHLDYHGSMESYAVAKRKLFEFDSLQQAIICADSEYAAFMLQACPANAWQYSAQNRLEADFSVVKKSFKQDGVDLTIRVHDKEYEVSIPLLGDFNVQNALAALAAVESVAGEVGSLVSALSELQGAPGRMQPSKCKGAPLVLVDYAHTPDALEVALKAVHDHASGDVVCVFGCGGDRDSGKRPLMLQAAQRNAHKVFLTSDNPRSEAPMAIIADAMKGLDKSLSDVVIEVDRRKAIREAILSSKPEDIVLVAGKGHENYQEVDGVRHHFDDREEAQTALSHYVS